MRLRLVACVSSGSSGIGGHTARDRPLSAEAVEAVETRALTCKSANADATYID